MEEYHLLQIEELDEQVATPLRNRTRVCSPKLSKWISALVCFLCGCAFTVLSLFAGQNVLSNEPAFAGELAFLSTFLEEPLAIQYLIEIRVIAPPGLISKIFTPDESFRLKVSSESDEAWRGILPSMFSSAHNHRGHADDYLYGLGVVQHPVIGPEIVSLAFVHQLHCLDTIRKNYFAAQDRNVTSENDKHILHCLDYVRQALQCQVDTNLEYRVASGTGDAAFTGYSEHQCRDFEGEFRFAEQWRVYNGKDASEWIKISEEETVPGRVINYDYISSRGDSKPI